jgi:hypothetical protein
MIPRARFILHVDEFDAPKGRIWMVKTRGLRINAHTVELHVPQSKASCISSSDM